MSFGVLAFGAAALTAAVALHQGWSPHLHRRQPATSGESTAERIGRNLREPSARVAAVAGVATHIPGLVYLVALNAISSARPGVVDAGAQVAVYDALWFLVPVASLVLVIARPGAAVRYLEAATAWVRRHDHAVVVGGLLLLGSYLVVKGAVRLLT